MAASCRKWGFRTLVAQTIFFFGSHKVTAKCFLDLIDLSRAEDRHIITRVTIAPEHSVYSFLHPCPSHLPCLSTEGFGAFSFPLLSVSHLPSPRKTACTLHSREIYSNYDAVTTAWGSSYHLKVWWSAEFINRIKCYQHQKVGQRVTLNIYCYVHWGVCFIHTTRFALLCPSADLRQLVLVFICVPLSQHISDLWQEGGFDAPNLSINAAWSMWAFSNQRFGKSYFAESIDILQPIKMMYLTCSIIDSFSQHPKM